MMFWIYDTLTGAIMGTSSAAKAPTLPTGYAAIQGDPAVKDPVGSLYVDATGKSALRVVKTALPADGFVSVDGAAAIPVAQAPTSGDHTLTLVGQYSGTITMVSLATAQAARWAAAKAYRTQKMAAGCASPLGRVQTDLASRVAIRDASEDATLNQVKLPGWSVTWIMADNSSVAHNATQMIAMAAAVRAYINACQVASQAVRAKIYATTTAAAASAIDITAGYPA